MSQVPEIWTHPDPQWWLRLGVSTTLHGLDICEECGHVRYLHQGKGPCKSPSAGLDALAGSPCLCGVPANTHVGWRAPMLAKAV